MSVSNITCEYRFVYQFTKYGLFFMWHVVTANKFAKGAWRYYPLKDGFRSVSQKINRVVILRWVGQKTSNFYQIFLLIVAFKKLYWQIYCYFHICLLLSWSRRYSMKWRTSTTRNFNNSWLLYLHFSRIINLCPNTW